MKCLISNFLVCFLSRLLNCVLNCLPAPQLQIKGAMRIFAFFLFCGFFAPAPKLAGGSLAVSAAARAESPSSLCRKAIESSAIRSKLFNPDGSIKRQYIGPEGQALFADEHFDGEMQQTLQNVSAVLSILEMELLGWRIYPGSTEEFRQLRGKLFNPDGSIKRQYIGQMKGYPLFADEHFNGKMQQTFLNVSAVLSRQDMRRLGWKAYIGSTEEFRRLRGKLFDPDGSIKRQYIGQTAGYPLFADEHFDGEMQRTIHNVSAVLSSKEMNQLGWWRQFQGTTEKFRRLRGALFNPDGSIKQEYIGQAKGYPLLADEHFDGEMQKTFLNVSAALSSKEMNQLEWWWQFRGTTEEFRQLEGHTPWTHVSRSKPISPP